MPADFTIADAIKQAAAKASGNGEGQDSIVAYLEFLRCKDNRLFNALIAKFKREQPCPQK
jgi:hypothetical protein